MRNGRCRMHGGATPAGPASANWIHGRYSRRFPPNLAAKAAQAESDPQLLSMRQDVALLELRIRQKLEELDRGDTADAWAQVGAALDLARQARQANPPDLEALDRALAQIAEALGVHANATATWNDLRELTQERSQVAAREWKRIETIGSVLTVQEGLALVRAIVDSVRRHCNDRNIQRAIGQDLMNMVQGIRARRSVVEGVEDGASV